MVSHGTDLDAVNVRDEPGIYVLFSLESATRYVVDARDELPIPRFYRAPAGPTLTGRYDRRWNLMTQFAALPRTWDGSHYLHPDDVGNDALPWTCRRGSRHILVTPEADPVRRKSRPYYWVMASAAARIERVSPEWLIEEGLA